MERQKLIERLKDLEETGGKKSRTYLTRPEARLFLELLEREEGKAYLKKGSGNKTDEIEPGDHLIIP